MNIIKKLLICAIMIILLMFIPLVINIAFQNDFDINCLQATWEPGDALAFYGSVLSFIGTAVLSTVALWQNHRFKIENDKAQERLEKISIQSNELNLISIILDRELSRIDKLKNLFDDFLDVCSIQSMNIILFRNDAAEELGKLNQKAENLLFKLGRETRQDYSDENALVIQISDTFEKVVEVSTMIIDGLLDCLQNEMDAKFDEKYSDELVLLTNKLIVDKEKYLYLLEKRVDYLMYNNISLNDVYCKLKKLEL